MRSARPIMHLSFVHRLKLLDNLPLLAKDQPVFIKPSFSGITTPFFTLKAEILIQIAVVIDIKEIIFLSYIRINFNISSHRPVDFQQFLFKYLEWFKAIVIEFYICLKALFALGDAVVVHVDREEVVAFAGVFEDFLDLGLHEIHA